MFRRQQGNDTSQAVPEKARYTKYYEHDGHLRAYANRSMLMAGLFGVIALVSLGFAIYVRLQPATVIRVSADGEATVVGARPTNTSPEMRSGLLSVLAATPASEAAPTDIEGRAVVRKFLESYMRYTPTSVDKNLADALNMMTANLRMYSLNLLRDQDSDRQDQRGADHLLVQDPVDRPGPWSGVDVPGLWGEGSSSSQE